MLHRFNKISSELISWYSENKRDLPWRHTHDPYKIWVSEVILQQTRVIQGLDYYLNFINRFPSIKILASSQEDEVLKYWQGLGYYSRARNMLKAAKIIVDKYQSIFPDNHQDIISLPGIGEYTAAAICSFAYNLPFAVLDGNVFRVLSRLFAIDTPIDTSKGKKTFKTIADDLLDKENPGTHNQAIMEFGALICTPKKPKCELCFLSDECLSFSDGTVELYPFKRQKVMIRNRYFNYLFVRYDNKTYLQQRKNKDIWRNLFEFPLIESESTVLSHEELIKHPYFIQLTKGNTAEIKIKLANSSIKHVLSHQHIFTRCFIIEVQVKTPFMNQFEEVMMEDLDNYPVSRLMEILLQNHLGK